MIKLSPRLTKIAEYVSYNTIADIGTDHGKLPIYLLQNGKIDFAVASDINDGPVDACKRNVMLYRFSEKISVRKGNGLSSLTINECDSLIIAGMGGDLISSIIFDGIKIAKSSKELILQPMTHVKELVEFLNTHNFTIKEQCIVKEQNKLYNIIKAVNGTDVPYSEFDCILPPKLRNDQYIDLYISILTERMRKERIGIVKSSDIKRLNEFDNLLKGLEIAYEAAKNN